MLRIKALLLSVCLVFLSVTACGPADRYIDISEPDPPDRNTGTPSGERVGDDSPLQSLDIDEPEPPGRPGERPSWEWVVDTEQAQIPQLVWEGESGEAGKLFNDAVTDFCQGYEDYYHVESYVLDQSTHITAVIIKTHDPFPGIYSDTAVFNYNVMLDWYEDFEESLIWMHFTDDDLVEITRKMELAAGLYLEGRTFERAEPIGAFSMEYDAVLFYVIYTRGKDEALQEDLYAWRSGGLIRETWVIEPVWRTISSLNNNAT